MAMAYIKKLGVFVKVPEPGGVKTRLVPPLTPEEACDLYRAFLVDLFRRLEKTKKVDGTVFFAGGDPDGLRDIIPPRYQLVEQEGKTLGERMENAFERLLAGGSAGACLIGSDSPDLPLATVKRAYLKLKHRDVVFGPACDGGYYLIALKRIIPELFRDIEWSGCNVLQSSLEIAEKKSLTVGTLPVWYDVDDAATLSLFRTSLAARRIEKRDRLVECERVLERLTKRLGDRFTSTGGRETHLEGQPKK
jgi:rSAM/selenodomain-associated transferase 1